MTSHIPGRLVRFLLVGASGVVVNMVILIVLTEYLGIPYLISSLFAIELSILGNFALNSTWTWSDKTALPLHERLIKYHAVAGVTALTANWGLLVFLTGLFAWTIGSPISSASRRAQC